MSSRQGEVTAGAEQGPHAGEQGPHAGEQGPHAGEQSLNSAGQAAPGTVRIRAATPDDVPQIYAFIVELAVYEREPEGVTGTPEMLADALFGPHPSAEALIAEVGGEPVGFAVFHGTFSTWQCEPGIWLEDLYVPERHRRAGAGFALLSHLAALAVERGCSRVEWTALDWNELALGFYQRLGAERLSEWELHRLTGEALRRVAAGQARTRRP